MCALAPQIQFGKWDEGPGRATPAPVVVPAAIGEVLVGYRSRTPVQTGAASYFQGAIELPLASREENVLGAPDGRLGLASVLAQATPDWITLAAYPSRKVPSLRTEIPDWIDQWEFSRFVTLATNDPSLAKRRMPGTSLPYGFLRHRLRRWDAMVNHAILGSKWAKRHSDRAYTQHRRSNGGARRDLEDLGAVINHHAKERFHRGIVRVVLPEKGLPRERWLTRSEAANLLWTCWRYRETQTIHIGRLKGQKIETDKRPLRHIARFILIGFYTGTRAGAIATASPYRAAGKSFVDLDTGIFNRLAVGKRASTKRQTPVPIPNRLLVHLRRWARLGISKSYFVEWAGKSVASVKTGFGSAVRIAGLDVTVGNVTPHTLRHTAATWLMQRAAPMWEAAGFLGMSEKTLRDTYGHHHPDHLRGAANAIGSRPTPKKVALVVSLAQRRCQKPLKTLVGLGGLEPPTRPL